MKVLILPAVLACAFFGIQRCKSVDAGDTTEFSCQGKTRCTEMQTCAEATYYLRTCPGVQIDGDGDGVPCEEQHCR